MARISTGKRLLFASIPFLLLIGIAETCVRVTHVAESCPNRFSDTNLWVCDPIQQFKLSPDLNVLGGKLSKEGFRTHDLAGRRDGVYRILSLGDSCTFGM